MLNELFSKKLVDGEEITEEFTAEVDSSKSSYF